MTLDTKKKKKPEVLKQDKTSPIAAARSNKKEDDDDGGNRVKRFKANVLFQRTVQGQSPPKRGMMY